MTTKSRKFWYFVQIKGTWQTFHSKCSCQNFSESFYMTFISFDMSQWQSFCPPTERHALSQNVLFVFLKFLLHSIHKTCAKIHTKAYTTRQTLKTSKYNKIIFARQNFSLVHKFIITPTFNVYIYPQNPFRFFFLLFWI